MSTLIFGHKNPDSDSICSALAFSHLKNQLGFDTTPCSLGNTNKESQYILDYFNMPKPKRIDNVKTQLKDLNLTRTKGILPTYSILQAYKYMNDYQLKTLPVTDENNKLLGIVTMNDIAVQSIKGDFYHLRTSLSNIVNSLNGTILAGENQVIDGQLSVVALYYKSIEGCFHKNKIIIVGDRYDIIQHAIDSQVKLIILTGDKTLPEQYIKLAKEKNVPMIAVPTDTYTVSKLINQCNYISSIMKKDNLLKFNKNEYVEDVKEPMTNTNYRNYPVIDDDHTFLGFINRKNLLNPASKQVILVDHNEYGQSAEGLQEAEILEIIDHHKLGDISTATPINFRNIPVGSTCTIVFQMFKEYNVEIPYNIAGVLLSGIISDTLCLKSPTTTCFDKNAIEELNKILNLDLDEFSMQMFKVGTSLEGQSIEEIFFKDFKEFMLEGNKVGVAQVFTLDTDDVFNRKEAFMDYIQKVHQDREYSLTVLLITDILKEGSYLLYHSNQKQLISYAFDLTEEQGIFVPEIVSRKKQVIPKILKAMKSLS